MESDFDQENWAEPPDRDSTDGEPSGSWQLPPPDLLADGLPDDELSDDGSPDSLDDTSARTDVDGLDSGVVADRPPLPQEFDTGSWAAISSDQPTEPDQGSDSDSDSDRASDRGSDRDWSDLWTVDLVGVDPDLVNADLPASDPDARWSAADWFALPELELDQLPEPAGGPPWVDVALLGSDPVSDGYLPAELADPAGPPGAAPPGILADLLAANAEDSSPELSSVQQWATLRASEDPAVQALAQFWGPA